jgi:16S rRNA (uracil1498-N3)-methyltransferase
MTMHRFFVSPDQIHGDTVTLTGDQARQITHVLRLHIDDQIYALDNSGWRYELKLITADSTHVRGRIVDKQIEGAEPTLKITLYQSMLKRDNFEWVLQKGTELGISAFVPMITQRSIVRQTAPKESKLSRWQRIVTEAAEQSGRGRIPELFQPLPFPDAIAMTSKNDLSLIPWAKEKKHTVRAALTDTGTNRPEASFSSAAIFIGPEGGFTEEEINDARSAGIVPITLGPRILRAETAALVTAALVLQELNELG